MFIEKYTLTPNKWITKIYQAFTKYHNTTYMFGETNQCDPAEKGSQIYHDYFTSVPISEMCFRRVEMKYKEGCVRYDEQARDVLTKFLETGKVTGKFSPGGQYYKNICYLNKTRKKVTRECCNRQIHPQIYLNLTPRPIKPWYILSICSLSQVCIVYIFIFFNQEFPNSLLVILGCISLK